LKMWNVECGLTCCARHARVLSPYPPLCGGGALGVSGIQFTLGKSR
jgi:hypothetical protein